MRSTVCALAALIVTTLPGQLVGQDTEWNRYTLEELTGVYVSSWASEACESAGVSAVAVLSEAESALTAAEVQVLTKESMLETPGHPELKITIACATGTSGSTSGAMGYSVSLRLQQAAQMIRDPQISLPESVTWSADSVGVVASSDAASEVTGALHDKLAEFATAFTAANTVEEPSG